MLHKNNRLVVPMILMTATFNNTLLGLLQNILGIKITLPIIFWGTRESFKKRHISITMRYLKQQFKVILSHITDKLETDIRIKKYSTAKKVNQLQIKLDAWLDQNSSIKGDTVKIIGSFSRIEARLYNAIYKY